MRAVSVGARTCVHLQSLLDRLDEGSERRFELVQPFQWRARREEALLVGQFEIEMTGDGERESGGVVGEDGEPRRQPLDEVRLEIAAEWTKAFRTWLATKPELGAQVEEAYNRALRGYVPPEFTAEPLSIARWSPDAPSLYPYQAKGARRVLAARRGLLAFDVGLGKSYTGCAILARARQEGWARRPVVLVPNSIVWKWKRDFARVLPDYRVLVIGSTRRALSHGPRKGRVVAQPDTPAERAEKWTAFQSGLADVVLLTYSALGRTRLDPDVLTEYVDGVAALRRQIALGRARRDGKAEKGETERQKATSAEATRAWLAERLEPPKGWEYDPGIEWHALGVDFLMVDESQNFKNLFMPEEREGGIPDAMGGTEESKRAWQLDFRCASVRKHTGGAGVVLLSATPAKNGPVEFYSAIHLVDPAAWERIGITDPEAFIDRFCAFEARPAQNAQGKLTVRQACVAFKNLHELRDVVFRYADFKTAEDVGLRIPDAQNVHHRVDLDEAQIDAIQGAWREITELKDRMKHLQGDANARMREILRLKMMGVAARVDLIAIHPALPGSAGMSRAALAAIDPHSGKVDAVVETVVSTALTACTLPGKGTPVCAADESFCLSCGHIVFVENVAAHAWLKAALVEAGVPAERIAVLNAAAAPDPETRQQIAEAFNGVGCPGDEEYVAPAFDVVIANGVAYEGVDLQRRTCAIHHVDLPWDPSTLQQRNGRGVRQGNTFGAVRIHYYLGRPSGDGRRLSLIDKKRSWMASLVKGQARTTNNPAAAVNVSVEELLLDIVPPEERARVLREREAEQEALERARRARVAAMASRMLSQAHARFRRAEKAPDAAEAGRLRAEGDQLLELLAAVDKDAWPWFSLATRVRTEAAFLPEVGPPLFPGMGVRRGAGLVEVGRAGAEVDGKPVLGLRDPTSYKPQQWTAHPAASLNAWAAELTPEDLAPGVDPLDAEALAAKFKADVVAGGFPGFTGWELAPAEWQARAWPVVEEGVITTLLTGRYAYSVVPIEHHGALAVAHVLELKHTLRGGRVLPPTEAGWEELLRLAKRSSVPWGQLNTMTRVWWKRPMPRGLTQAQET